MLNEVAAPEDVVVGVALVSDAEERAFVISSMLKDWSGIDIDRAIEYIRQCYVRHTLPVVSIYYLTDSTALELRRWIWANAWGRSTR